MIRHRVGRFPTALTAAATALMLLGALLLPAAATAANTRTLWIGAPDLSVDSDGNGIPDNNGLLFPTPVTVPAAPPAPQHLTLVDVQILSTDNQTLAHAVLTIRIADRDGLSINTFFDPDGGTDADACTVDGDVITCDYGNLGARAERTVSVLVNVTSAYVVAGAPTLVTAQVTTNNENGSNQQLFTASSGSFAVGAFTNNGLSTLVPDGVSAQLATTGIGAGGNLSTKVNFIAGPRETVRITEGSSTAALYPCPVGLSCQPDFSEVVTASGTFEQSPYFTWTLTARVTKTYNISQGFVAHYTTGSTSPDWILLLKSKSSFCGNDTAAKIEAQGHCVAIATLSKPVGGFSTLTLQVVMDSQGGMKY